MKTFRWIIITVLALSLALPAMPASAAPQYAVRTAVLSLVPHPNPGLVGGDVSVNLIVAVANIDPGVAGVEIYLGYDPAVVSPPPSELGVAETKPDFFGVSNVSINEVLPAAQCPGAASPCVRLVLAGPAQISKSGIAASFHFRGLVESTAACFTVLSSTLKDADGKDVVHTPASSQCVPIIFRITATANVLRQGTPGIPNPGVGTLACASVTGTKVTPVENFGPITTGVAGKFSLTGLTLGTFTFRATYPGYLAAQKTGVVFSSTSPTTYELGTINLRGGDVNGDNAINILDIGSVISKFGRYTGVPVRSVSTACTTTDEPADINDDGLINISDLAIAAGNWGLTGPTVWP